MAARFFWLVMICAAPLLLVACIDDAPGVDSDEDATSEASRPHDVAPVADATPDGVASEGPSIEFVEPAPLARGGAMVVGQRLHDPAIAAGEAAAGTRVGLVDSIGRIEVVAVTVDAADAPQQRLHLALPPQRDRPASPWRWGAETTLVVEHGAGASEHPFVSRPVIEFVSPDLQVGGGPAAVAGHGLRDAEAVEGAPLPTTRIYLVADGVEREASDVRAEADDVVGRQRVGFTVPLRDGTDWAPTQAVTLVLEHAGARLEAPFAYDD